MKTYIKVVTLLGVLGITFGVIAPMLISAASNLAVIGGILVVLAVIPWGYYAGKDILQNFNSNKEIK